MTQAAAPDCIAYERIAGLTTAMLEAARASQWEILLDLETECRTVFTQLVNAGAAAAATPETAQRKAMLIRQVLADDAEIRNLIEPWMAELGQWLGMSSRSHRLKDAYSAGG
jgi:flagellar protein FliT